MASDELKNVLVSATQGGLNLDDNIHAIPEGDGRERTNIMVGYEGNNGGVEPVLGYEKITFPVSGATFHGVDSDVDGNLYYVYSKTGTYYIYRYRPNVNPAIRWTKILETTEVLFNTANYVQVKYGDGYVFITQDGYAPLMINVVENISFNSYSAKISNYWFNGANTRVAIPKTGYCPSVNDEVSILLDTENTDRGVPSVTGTVIDVTDYTPGAQYWITLDTVNATDYGGVVGYLVEGNYFGYAPFIENLTTARPVPQRCPKVEFTSDSSLSYNKFSESIFTFGYSFVYEDGYETKISPLSPADLTRLEYDAAFRTNVSTLYNRVNITIRPYSGVDKVRIYAKKDNVSESFYRVVELEATNEVVYSWDGVLAEDVLDNESWAVGSESIPISAKNMEYLPDDRITYGVCNEGYELEGIKLFTELSEEAYATEGSRESAKDENNNNNLEEIGGVFYRSYTYDFSSILSFDTAPSNGVINVIYKIIISYFIGASVPVQKYEYTYNVNVNISSGDTENDVLNNIIIALENESAKIEAENISGNLKIAHDATYPLGTSVSSVGAIGSVYYEVSFSDPLYSKTIKEGSTEQFGVVFYDKYNRSAAYTNDSNVVSVSRTESNNTAYTYNPLVYIGGTLPSWAVSYQFIVKRNFNTWGHYIIPCKRTYGSWGTSGRTTVDSKAIKLFNGAYGINFNRLIDVDINSNAALIYQFKEGDYCRFNRYYTPSGWWTVNQNSSYRITGTKVDTDGTYYLIDDESGTFGNIFTTYYEAAWTADNARYLQFEVFNVGTLTLDAGEVWTEIGERYSCVNGFEGTLESTLYPEEPDAGNQNFYAHEIDYGNAIYRNVYRANLDLENTWDESAFYIESPYLYDSSNTRKLINVGRPHVVNDNKSSRRNIARHGGKKFDGTDVDFRRVFSSKDYANLGNEYGELTGMAVRDNVLRMYLPYGTASVYFNAVEGNLPDGTSNYVYTDRVFGTLRWSKEKYGCSDIETITKSADSVYFYDSINLDVIRDTQGGLIPVGGKISVGEYSNDGKMKSFLTSKVIMGYCPRYEQIYATRVSDKATVWYSELYGRWMGYYTIQPSAYVTAQNNLWSVAGIHSFKHHQSGSNTYDSSGATSTSNSVFDIVVGQDRAVNKLFEAVVQHVDNKQDVYLKSYSKDWSSYMYTKIPKGIFKKWDDVFYSDITKGIKGLSSNFRTAMMYEGDDMIGKVGVFKIDTSEDFNLSALEVRYVLLNK